MATVQPPEKTLDLTAGKQDQQNELPQQFELTPDENKVLQELSREAYFKRAIPLGFGAMLGVATLVRSGALRGHPKFGPLPKMIGAGAFGYFAGKISYIPEMQNQILERIPNSNLAAQIRKAKKLPEIGETPSTPQWEPPAKKGLDSYRPSEGLDERFRPSLDREVKMEEPQEEKKSITYDELRRRNREEASKNPGQPGAGYRDSPWMPQKPFPPPNPEMFAEPNKEPEETPAQPAPPAPPARRKRTNIWGDEIE